MRWQGVTKQQYDEARRRVDWEGNRPAGMTTAIASAPFLAGNRQVLFAEPAVAVRAGDGRGIFGGVPFDQYHEPPDELSEETRTFARICTSLIEEAEAIGWYEQRLSLERDREARAIMENAQEEEFKHFGMNLEFLLRRKPVFREILQGILFQPGDIVEHGERAEDEAS